jgi:hypothetical protein
MLGSAKKLPIVSPPSTAPARAAVPAAAAAEAEPLVLGVFENDTFANVLRYGLTGAVVVVGFWMSGASLKDLLSTPSAIAGVVWNWGTEKN